MLNTLRSQRDPCSGEGAKTVRLSPSLIKRRARTEHLVAERRVHESALGGNWDLNASSVELPLVENTESNPDISIAIDRRGHPLLVDGACSLARHQCLGTPLINARVVLRHSDWNLFREKINHYVGRHGRVYQKITHFDLEDVPFQHDNSRIDIVLPTLRAYAGTTGRLLDIGSHWGQMCHLYEENGFICTAVEKKQANCYFAERLRIAAGKEFEVRCMDILDSESHADFDIICALNIFHHFLKKAKTFAKWIQLLQNLKCKALIFQSHSEGDDQMVGAFANYHPRDFAEVVRIHSNFKCCEEIGIFDGRLLFAIHN